MTRFDLTRRQAALAVIAGAVATGLGIKAGQAADMTDAQLKAAMDKIRTKLIASPKELDTFKANPEGYLTTQGISSDAQAKLKTDAAKVATDSCVICSSCGISLSI